MPLVFHKYTWQLPLWVLSRPTVTAAVSESWSGRWRVEPAVCCVVGLLTSPTPAGAPAPVPNVAHMTLVLLLPSTILLSDMATGSEPQHTSERVSSHVQRAVGGWHLGDPSPPRDLNRKRGEGLRSQGHSVT